MSIETQPLLDVAHTYWNAGLTPMPRVIGSQEPAYIDAHGTIYQLRWGEHKSKQPDWTTVENWFSYGDHTTLGLCLLTGSHPSPRKAGVAFPQILDLETATVFDDFKESLNFLGHADILHRCVIERTPSGGAHIGFLCRTIDTGQKVPLARRDDGKLLIELLEHQPCTVFPTTIRCKPEHPDGVVYTLLQGSWDHLQEISTEQRQILIDTARALNEKPEHTFKEKTGKRTAGEVLPGEHLNNTIADATWWTDLLTKHGWRDVSRLGLASQGILYFQRPGKIGKEPSATYGMTGQFMYCFSSNAEPFDAETSYSPFAAYTLLEHGGDFKAAAKALATQFAFTRKTKEETHQHQNGHRPAKENSTPLSDVSNAETFAAEHPDAFRYCTRWRTWLTWTATHWQRDESGAIMRQARQTIKGLLRGAEDMPEDILKAMMSHVKSSLRNSSLEGMLKQAQVTLPYPIGPEAFDRDAYLLNCRNGTLDLRTGTLITPHRQTDYITRCISVDYVPQASCSTWQTFLWRIMGGSGSWSSPDESAASFDAADAQAKTLIEFLQRAIGYSLTGDTSEECFFLLHGSGRNGKSKLLETIAALLGEYAKQAEMSTFLTKDKDSVRDDIADLHGARFISAAEVQEGRRLAEAMVKQLTGGDRVKARFLFSNYFEYTPTYKVWLAVNHLPVIRGQDEAIWERVKRIPFQVTIPRAERDKQLLGKLVAELPGILAWAVHGCLKWQQDGLQEPEVVTKATQEYRTDMDVFGRFIEECCLVSSSLVVKASHLYSAYRIWCQENNEHEEPQQSFGRRLTDKGFIRKRGTGGVHRWEGIGLLPNDKDGVEM